MMVASSSVIHLTLDGQVNRDPGPYETRVLSSINAAALSQGGARSDTGELVLDAAQWPSYRRDANERYFAQLMERHGIKPQARYDSIAAQAAGFARQFEMIHTQILEEKRKPLNLERLLQMDRSVPQGPKTHTWRRATHTGEARRFRGGDPIPVVNTAYGEETFRIIHFVVSVRMNFFQTLTTEWANLRQFERDSMAANRVLREAINRVGFRGDVPSQVYGILTHPYLPKPNPLVSFTPAAIAADPTGTRVELNRLANYAYETSGGAFMPNRFATSIRIRNALMQTQNSPGGTDTSVGQFWLDGQEFINAIMGIQEFQGIGPGGEDGLFFYSSEMEDAHYVMVQPPTALPMHDINSLDSEVVFYTTVGGVVMPNVGAHVLALGQGN